MNRKSQSRRSVPAFLSLFAGPFTGENSSARSRDITVERKRGRLYFFKMKIRHVPRIPVACGQDFERFSR